MKCPSREQWMEFSHAFERLDGKNALYLKLPVTQDFGIIYWKNEIRNTTNNFLYMTTFKMQALKGGLEEHKRPASVRMLL